MIKTFCDCCGVEIKQPVNFNTITFPAKRVRIELHSNVCGVIEEFLVELFVTANIYKPENLMDRIEESEFIGQYICANCIVERLIQRE